MGEWCGITCTHTYTHTHTHTHTHLAKGNPNCKLCLSPFHCMGLKWWKHHLFMSSVYACTVCMYVVCAVCMCVDMCLHAGIDILISLHNVLILTNYTLLLLAVKWSVKIVPGLLSSIRNASRMMYVYCVSILACCIYGECVYWMHISVLLNSCTSGPMHTHTLDQIVQAWIHNVIPFMVTMEIHITNIPV